MNYMNTYYHGCQFVSLNSVNNICSTKLTRITLNLCPLIRPSTQLPTNRSHSPHSSAGSPLWLHGQRQYVGCVPHSVLLQFICRAPSVNKCPLSANVDAPLEKRRGRTNFGRVPARKEASDANGGNCGGRIRQLMAPHTGA